MDDEEIEFKKVKEYVYDNPGATISETSQETGVSVEKIIRFLREERLEIKSEESNMVLECERCGVPIKSGRYCERCKRELNAGFRKEFGLDKPGSGGRMPIRAEKDKMYTATRRKND